MNLKLQSAVALLTSSCLVCLAASPSSIGFVVTNGQAQVDGAFVRGNSTLFPGSLIRTGTASSDLVFPGGSNLLLQANSAVKVYRDYAVLETGSATQRGAHGYVLANGVRVTSLSPIGAVVVGVPDKSHVEVTAQSGAAEVRNQAGALVARLEPGRAFRLAIQDAQQPASPQTPAAPSTPPPASGPAPAAVGSQMTIHGILRKDHAGRYGHYLITDLASKVTYELQGSGLDELVGGSVEVIGSVFDATPAEGATQVISVSDIHQMPLSEMTGNSQAAAPAPDSAAPVETAPTTPAQPEVGTATPPPAPAEAPAAAPDASTAPPPLPVHSDTAKIIIIVGLAAGVGVGVALGLAGGKSSTVSPE